MEWLIKKRKAFDQRGDMAIAAWAEQQQREMNLRARRLSRSKVNKYLMLRIALISFLQSQNQLLDSYLKEKKNSGIVYPELLIFSLILIYHFTVFFMVVFLLEHLVPKVNGIAG